MHLHHVPTQFLSRHAAGDHSDRYRRNSAAFEASNVSLASRVPTCIYVHVLFEWRPFMAEGRACRTSNSFGKRIERMRYQVQRQRREIRQLQRAGIPSTSAEALLDRMLKKIDNLCAERDRLKKEQPGHNKGKVVGGRRW